jgi:secondary thiamine-phosphate synthase enzyme
MRQALVTLRVATKGRGFYEITRDVQGRVAQAGVQTGLCTLHLQHTSASLLIQENADPDVLHDLNAFVRRIGPEDTRLYRHSEEGPDDMPAHIRAALTANHLSIPAGEGGLDLGIWHGVYLFEQRTPAFW